MWTQAEAEKGDCESQYKLAWLYDMGSHGIEKNIEKAKKWYAKAAAQHHREAHSRLAKLNKLAKIKA